MVECVINFLTEVYADINSLEVNMVSSMFRLLLSMILGMVVGAERKRKGQVAMLLSIYVPQVYLGLKNGDPGRIAAQVITGIGFIGGGAMIHMKGAVKGLTTAAGIWMTAIIGMAVGIGMYMCSIGATLLILMTLVSFEQYEKRKKMGQESKVIGLTVEGVLENIDDYKRVFNEADVHLSTFFVEYDYDKNVTELNFVVLAHVYTDLMPLLSKIRGVNPTKKLTLSSQLDI